MTLDSIIERLEKAEGGSLELDFWISVRVYDPCEYTDAELQADIDSVGIEGMHIDAAFTSSVDAAIALAEKAMPGWCWLVRNDEDAGAFANVTKRNGNYEDGVDAFPVWAKTPALALVTSLLKAKQLGVGD